jgi:nucleoside-triphosphatase THEP1
MKPAANRIATVVGADDPTTQALFAASVAKWRAAGLKVVGLVAETHGLADRTCRAGFLRDVVSGKMFSIYLETPPSHTSCHLDAAGVESACDQILRQIPESDLVVLSKFGKLEADRGGLVRAFEAAIAAGKPVLTTVSSKHRDAWRAFATNAIDLAPDHEALDRWHDAIKNDLADARLSATH